MGAFHKLLNNYLHITYLLNNVRRIDPKKDHNSTYLNTVTVSQELQF